MGRRTVTRFYRDEKKRIRPITKRKGKKVRKKVRKIVEKPLKPRIIHHIGWPPPDSLIREAKREVGKPDRKTASDIEALIYLNTASMAAPMTDQWTRIYFHLAYNYLKGKGKIPEDAEFMTQHKTLSDYDARELRRLKDWIFRQQQKDLAERRKMRQAHARPKRER